MTNEERIEQQLRKADMETQKKQEEINEERKRMQEINEEEEEIARFFKRYSRGIRGGR